MCGGKVIERIWREAYFFLKGLDECEKGKKRNKITKQMKNKQDEKEGSLNTAYIDSVFPIQKILQKMF